MALIWSRNKIWGGTFTTDVDVADGTNNASVVPASNFLGLVQGSETDPRNRSKWFSSVIGQVLRAVLHKEAIDKDTRKRELSKNRAERVYKFLHSRGISKVRMTFKGYGNSQPLGKDEQFDRRVELVITKI